MEIENPQYIEEENNLNDYINNQRNQNLINEMLIRKQTRLNIDMDELRSDVGKQCADYVVKNPQQAISLLRTKLNKIISDSMPDEQGKKKKINDIIEKQTIYQIGFTGNMGRNAVTPRGLNAQLANNLVQVNGIVSRVSLNYSQLMTSVHLNQQNEQNCLIKNYYDQYDVASKTSLNTSNSIPTKNKDNQQLLFEQGYSKFKDVQKILLQELPESAPSGLLPRSVDVILSEDLVGKVKPGDKIKIYGVFKCLKSEQTKTTGILRTILIACSLQQLNEQQDLQMTSEDIKNIKEISQRKDMQTIFTNSIAPSIYGHEHIKKAILLQLLGGTTKTVGNGTHLRGDINILMIGDPSTAKSQMIRYTLATAPLALNTTGRGSSGVGLTAAVVFDRETGERHLEAGAMVLADKGIVCIDEFDKMNEADRVSLHEVMEQQTVTIAKAGIYCSLNARCGVLAAANPIYGEYQMSLPPTKNIGLPDSLLSRFDLLFIVLDQKEENIDRLIAERVVRNHRYRPENYDIVSQLSAYQENDDFILEPEVRQDNTNDNQKRKVFEKHNNVLHGEKKEILCQSFLKKYIQYAKTQYNSPYLTDQSKHFISQYYTALRKKNFEDLNSKVGNLNILPVTTRTLETVIRLATAYAKLRLSKNIELVDCREAIKLLNYALYQNENAIQVDIKDDEFDEMQQEAPKQEQNKKVTRSQNKQQQQQQKNNNEKKDKQNKEAVNVENNPNQQNVPQKQTTSTQQLKKIKAYKAEAEQAIDLQISAEQQTQFQKTIFTNIQKICSETSQSIFKIDQLYNKFKQQGLIDYSKQFFNNLLQKMAEENRLFIDKDEIYLL